MLSNAIIKNFGIRIKLMEYAGLTVYGWDKRKSELTPHPSNYLYWNWVVCLAGGFYLCLIYAIQIYIKLKNADEELVSTISFATLVLTWGELILITIINMLAVQIYSKQDEIMYVMNEMFTYHSQIKRWLEEREVRLDERHKRRIAYVELIVYFSAYFSYFFPCIMFFILFHPIEPIHNIMQEWLEFDVTFKTLKWSYILLLPPLFMAMHAAANTIFVYAVMVSCYYIIATSALEDLTPVRVTRREGIRHCTFETEFYGVLDDKEIIMRYRCQQLFNVLVNDILASWRVSLHHVACLATCAIMIYFAINFQNVLEETGMVGYVVVGGSILAPLIIQYYEALMLGALVDISETFKDTSNKLVRGRSLMKAFSRSCVTFYVEEAYPYFHIYKNTFLEFSGQVVDYTITLLLW